MSSGGELSVRVTLCRRGRGEAEQVSGGWRGGSVD